eukprot:15480627-Alexandrium_andersonii.AAC.1
MAAATPFPAAQAQALADAIKRHLPIALCGPPGSGKRTLLRQGVAEVAEVHLDYMVTDENVDGIARRMGGVLAEDGTPKKVVWVLLAELVTPTAVAALREATRRSKQQ